MSVNQSVALHGTENLQNLYLEKMTVLPNVGTFFILIMIFSGDSQGHFISQSLKIFF